MVATVCIIPFSWNALRKPFETQIMEQLNSDKKWGFVGTKQTSIVPKPCLLVQGMFEYNWRMMC